MLINEGGETISPWATYGEPTIKVYDMTLRKPAAPTITEVSPYDESDGMSVKFMMETKDVDGKYIMPDCLYYNVYFDTDEKPMTFTEADYSGLDEDNDRHSLSIRGQAVFLFPRRYALILCFG